jgi:integrase
MVPSREEVDFLLNAVRSIKYRTILITTYGAGLRISEACRLQVSDVDSRQMVLHIREAKRGKDRLVPLSPRMLIALRTYWGGSKTARILVVSGPPGRRAHQQGCRSQGPQARAGGGRVQETPDAALASARIRHPS